MTACGGPGNLSVEEKQRADSQWRATYRSVPAHRSVRTFALSARFVGDHVVLVTVQAGSAPTQFSDSSLGARVIGYRDGRWIDLSGFGVSQPAVRTLRPGESVREPITVTREGKAYRAIVRPYRPDDGPRIAWVHVRK
jgi:hypothetical protein